MFIATLQAVLLATDSMPTSWTSSTLHRTSTLTNCIDVTTNASVVPASSNFSSHSCNYCLRLSLSQALALLSICPKAVVIQTQSRRHAVSKDMIRLALRHLHVTGTGKEQGLLLVWLHLHCDTLADSGKGQLICDPCQKDPDADF